MASVKDPKTKAQEMLEIALGKKRICFGKLSKTEVDELLRSVLSEVRLRELRGFKPLRELLTFRPGSVVYGGPTRHTLDVEVLDLSEDVLLLANGFKDSPPITLDTHVMSLSRNAGKWTATFKRNESDEETEDYGTASSWGRSAYRYKGSGEVLTLRRSHNHTRADENLIITKFSYVKVPLKQRYVITKMELQPFPLEKFRQHYGSSYARVAVELIRELGSVYRRTSDELAFQSDSMRKKVTEFERLSEALSFR
ncbi:MAG: hypothetical protein WCS97_00170 [Candidatus Paceibacterota bacterium]|jgi:hypothetical protein